MPEAAVDEDDGAAGAEDDVGLAGEIGGGLIGAAFGAGIALIMKALE
jgi:hypothetical protein